MESSKNPHDAAGADDPGGGVPVATGGTGAADSDLDEQGAHSASAERPPFEAGPAALAWLDRGVTGATAFHPAADYCRQVLDGRRVAGRLERLAVERHLRDLDLGPDRGLYFDEVAGQRGIDWFGFLVHIEGELAGQPIVLEGWQQFVILCVFGWKRADATRRFRNAYEEVARKNGKSTKLAGVGLYLFVADGEPGAQVYSAATKRDQAKIVWGTARNIALASPHLAGRVGATTNNLYILQTFSKFEPLGADSNTLDGLNVSGAIVDEVHAHPDGSVFNVIDSGTGARRQPLVWEITTAGDDEQSICYEHRDYTRNVLEGVFEDDSWFGIIFAPDKDDEEFSETAWAKANPNLGVSVKLDDLQEKAKRAQRTPRSRNEFLQKRENRWVNASAPWLDLGAWKSNKRRIVRAELVNRRCVGGLDLASKIDISAWVLVFPPEAKGDDWILLPQFFMPADNVKERQKEDRVPYGLWVKQGWITATPGNIIDYDAIEARIKADAEFFQGWENRQIRFDAWNATQISTRLGAEGHEMVQVPQTIRHMTEASKVFEAQVLAGLMRHGGNPVLGWMASNVVVMKDTKDNYMPNKKKSRKRIDGITASITAMTGFVAQVAEGPSVYETRGVIAV